MTSLASVDSDIHFEERIRQQLYVLLIENTRTPASDNDYNEIQLILMRHSSLILEKDGMHSINPCQC